MSIIIKLYIVFIMLLVRQLFLKMLFTKVKGKNMSKKVTWLHLSDLHFRVTEDNF